MSTPAPISASPYFLLKAEVPLSPSPDIQADHYYQVLVLFSKKNDFPHLKTNLFERK
jgi:hypothetical protein